MKIICDPHCPHSPFCCWLQDVVGSAVVGVLICIRQMPGMEGRCQHFCVAPLALEARHVRGHVRQLMTRYCVTFSPASVLLLPPVFIPQSDVYVRQENCQPSFRRKIHFRSTQKLWHYNHHLQDVTYNVGFHD